jgi:hypothetical protein
MVKAPGQGGRFHDDEQGRGETDEVYSGEGKKGY